MSTLAVLSDTRNLNAFNLDAEGKRQNNLVAARQTYFQSNDLSDELQNFDWFLLKSGDKGIMTGEREIEIGKLITKSISFSKENQWLLPDGTEATLYRRDPLSLDVEKIRCPKSLPEVSIKRISKGLELQVLTTSDKLNGAKALIKLHNKTNTIIADQSIGNGFLRLNSLNNNSCFNITQRFSKTLPSLETVDRLNVDFQLISESKSLQKVPVNSLLLSHPNSLSEKNDSIAIDRIETVYEMGKMLRLGNMNQLFARVGQINQSDPEQIYLKDSELIIKNRLENDPQNIDYLYGLALVQTLQKKADFASHTFSEICLLDKNNQFPYLAKAAVDIYRFKPRLAKISLSRAANINNNLKSDETYKAIETIANLMDFDFIKTFNLLFS